MLEYIYILYIYIALRFLISFLFHSLPRTIFPFLSFLSCFFLLDCKLHVILCVCALHGNPSCPSSSSLASCPPMKHNCFAYGIFVSVCISCIYAILMKIVHQKESNELFVCVQCPGGNQTHAFIPAAAVAADYSPFKKLIYHFFLLFLRRCCRLASSALMFLAHVLNIYSHLNIPFHSGKNDG